MAKYPTRGFASMPKDKQRAIASKGGKAAHAQGTAHEWDATEARDAGKIGGARSRAKRDRVNLSEER
jgi:general stress protein YciG